LLHWLSGNAALVLVKTVKLAPARFVKLNWNEPLPNRVGLIVWKLGLNTPSTAPMSANGPETRNAPRWSLVKVVPLVQPLMAGEPGWYSALGLAGYYECNDASTGRFVPCTPENVGPAQAVHPYHCHHLMCGENRLW
jgi:hypothetical protein